MNSGEPIGGFVETCAVLDMINNIKRQSGLYN
jgi:hypothetical protein